MNESDPQEPASVSWITSGGEMGARIRAYDWSQTPLGPIEGWCQSLRTSVSISLECEFPIILWWGPELTVLYNDEYRAALGAKHPAALGQSGMKVWAEIWDTIGPMLAQVVERAESTRSRDLLLHIDRYGYPEEAYFSFSYSPIHDERGQVSGVFCPVIETTEKVIGERRLRTLRDLAAQCSGVENEASVCRSAAAVLADNPHDVPFALFYCVNEGQSLAELQATAGIAPGAIAAPTTLRLNADDVTTANWSLGAVAQHGKSFVLDDLRHRFADLPTGAWKESPHSAVALPVLLPGQDRPRAIVVLAASPMRALDDDYLTFFNLVATQVAAGLADAKARAEERRRAEALAELDRAKTTFFSGSTFVVSVRRGSAHLSPDRIVAPRASSDLQATDGRQDARRQSDTYVHEGLRWLPSELTRRTRADSAGPARSTVKEDTRPTARPRARILLVDDNADMREYVQRLLVGAGYDVDTTVDGQQALETALARRPDLAVIDVMMPRLDGSALLKALRADEQTATVPIIMLSARAGEEARIEGLNAGADDYLIKPFSARELLARVGAHLEMARTRTDAEQRVRTSEQRLRNVIEQLPAGVGVMNTVGVWELTNSLMSEYVPDAVPSRLAGRPAKWPAWDAERHAIPPDMWPSARALRGERVVPGVEMLCKSDGGAESWLRVSASPLRLDDRIVGATVVVRDITRAKRAEEAMLESQALLQDADRRKDEFLAMLAHELRNPLAPIRTGLEVIRRARDTPPSVERVRATMERQVGHMVRLIDDLLDVSRITSGKIQLQRKRTLLTDLVNNAVDANRSALDIAQVQLNLNLPDEACVLNVDPTRVMQVLSNLLHNASKFTPPGGTVTVTATCRSPKDATLPGEVVITVADTGIGISQDMLPRVFELFTQAALHSEGRQPGLGIGLALARRLVEMHGGVIDVRSDGLGHGCSFTVRLPLARETAPITSFDDATSEPQVARRVVVIDDNEDAARMMALLIEVLGSEARLAHSGAAGILAVGEFHPDVVLLDIGMPEMDGYETCRRLRKEPAGASAFIVAVTGWGQEQDKRRAVDAGFDAHLTKPADPAILEQILTGRAHVSRRSVTAP